MADIILQNLVVSSKRNGRPKIDWDPSKARRVLRLYFMTDLTVPGIRDQVAEGDFHPGTRTIQGQLKILLPEYSKLWPEYRPSKVQTRNRLHQLKQSRRNQFYKHQRRAGRRVNRTGSHDGTQSFEEELMPMGVPSFNIPPAVDMLYSGRDANLTENSSTTVGESEYSDKEIVIGTPSQQIAEYCFSSTASVVSKGARTNSQVENEQPSNQTAPKLENHFLGKDGASGMRSVESLGRVATQVSSRLSSLRHRVSVMSSGSWRSSVLVAPSVSSGQQSIRNHVPLTRDEFNSWNEFVDESIMDSTPNYPKGDGANSLYARPCCDINSLTGVKNGFTCETCGCSELHMRARLSSNLFTGYAKEPNLLDYFGNTPLHHAAAAGNISQVLQYMSCPNRPSTTNSQQNSSGETFLHVFRLREPSHLTEYETILRKACNSGFPFEILDHSGRRVADRIGELLEYWDISSPRLTVIVSVMKISDQIECREGKLRPVGSELTWQEYRNSHRSKETPIISTLNNWSKEPKSNVELERIIRNSNIHIRDRKGYTALALASALGLRNTVALLLELGANPNTRSYHKTSVMENAAIHLGRAQKEDNNPLYAKILSCMVLLSDSGGKASVDDFDEFGLANSRLEKSKDNGFRAAMNKALVTTRKIARLPARRQRSQPQIENIPLAASLESHSDENLSEITPFFSTWRQEIPPAPFSPDSIGVPLLEIGDIMPAELPPENVIAELFDTSPCQQESFLGSKTSPNTHRHVKNHNQSFTNNLPVIEESELTLEFPGHTGSNPDIPEVGGYCSSESRFEFLDESELSHLTPHWTAELEEMALLDSSTSLDTLFRASGDSSGGMDQEHLHIADSWLNPAITNSYCMTSSLDPASVSFSGSSFSAVGSELFGNHLAKEASISTKRKLDPISDHTTQLQSSGKQVASQVSISNGWKDKMGFHKVPPSCHPETESVPAKKRRLIESSLDLETSMEFPIYSEPTLGTRASQEALPSHAKITNPFTAKVKSDLTFEQPALDLSTPGFIDVDNSAPSFISTPQRRFLHQFQTDFPDGYELIPTDGSQLLCGLRAIQHSIQAQISCLGLRVPSVDELQQIATTTQVPQATNDNDPTEITDLDHNFHVDHLAAILQEYGRREGFDLQLGYIVEEHAPLILSNNLNNNLTIWIHNDNAELLLKAQYSHYSGMKARLRNPSSFPDLEASSNPRTECFNDQLPEPSPRLFQYPQIKKLTTTHSIVCNFCGFEFCGKDRTSNLKRHKEICTSFLHQLPIRRFKCTYPGCEKIYTRSDNLLVHKMNARHM